MKIKENISVLILLFVNSLFAYKYLSRYTEWAILITIALFVMQIIAYKRGQTINVSNSQKQIILYVFVFFISSVVIFSHYKIPLSSLNVDRWSVIYSFFMELNKGNYPYYATSNMGNYPGPMPVYFLISFPFYYFGILVLLSCIGYCIFFILFIKDNTKNKKLVFLLFYFFTSVFLLWEITTRSNIFTFTTINLFALNGFIELKNKSSIRFYTVALLAGLLLSTRSVYVLAYIIFFLSSLNNGEITLRKMFVFGLIALIGFISTFIPFIYFYKNDFFNMNPFIVQSSFLVPKSYTIIFILISIFLSFMVRNRIENFFYSGISLFVSILIYSIYHIYNYGYYVSYINSKIDISYFIFSVPFFIIYLKKIDSDRNYRINEMQSV